MEMSISFVTKTNMTSLKHNNRDLTEAEFNEPAHQHIQRDLSDENIYIKQGNIKETYDELFGEALEKYNSKQKRADRRIEDYYHHVKKSKTLDLQREIVVSVGTKEDWEQMSFSDKKQVAKKLEEYIFDFEKRHTHLHVYNAVIHLDEAGAPHAHFNLVPVAEGYKNGLERQPSFKKALQNEGYLQKGRGQLKEFRDRELASITEKLKELHIERKLVGTNDIKDMHEYKRLIEEAKELERELTDQLVANFQAPEYLNHEGQFVSREEYIQAKQLFLDTMAPIFGEKDFSWRETTLQEKLDWAKSHQVEELSKLEQARKPLREEILYLEEILGQKYDQLAKIDERASESLSELSKAESYINTLESQSNALEVKIERLESEYSRLVQQKSVFMDLKAMSESELGQIKPKKNVFGKEHVELTREQFEKFKGLIYRSKNYAHQKEIELDHVKRQLPLKQSKTSFEATLERAKAKARGEDVEDLKKEIRGLRSENSILRQQNNKMLDILDRILKPKEWNQLLDELEAIKPIVDVVKKAVKSISKGLEL